MDIHIVEQCMPKHAGWWIWISGVSSCNCGFAGFSRVCHTIYVGLTIMNVFLNTNIDLCGGHTQVQTVLICMHLINDSLLWLE